MVWSTVAAAGGMLRGEAEELREGGLALHGAAAEVGDMPRHLSQGAQDERPATKPSTL